MVVRSPAPLEPIPVVRPYVEPDPALLERLADVLRSGRLSNDGPAVRELEAEARAWTGGSEVVAVSNGTAALELTLAELAPRGGAAVLPAYTFAATLNAARAAGLEPLLVDIDPGTFTMAPRAVEAVLQRRRDVRVVLPVTVFGVCPDVAALGALADAASASLVLDHAHGFGSEGPGDGPARHVHALTLSLHATKVVPAGEGGLVATSDPALAGRLRRRRAHGLAAEPLDSTPGTNAKLGELAAVVALHSLGRLPVVLQRRRAYAARLLAALARFPAVFTPQALPPGLVPNHQDFGARVRLPAGGLPEVQDLFLQQGVATRRYFWPPLHRLPAWRGRFDLPVTDAVADSWLCLPLHSRMDEPTLGRVEAAIEAVGRQLDRSSPRR